MRLGLVVMGNKKIKFYNVRMIIYIISVILVLFVFVGKISPKCYFYENYGFLCPACGLTRATISILKLKINDAISYNAFYALVLMPFLMFLIIDDVYNIVKRSVCKEQNRYSIVEIILGEKSK